MAKILVTRVGPRHVVWASHDCADDEFSILVKIQAPSRAMAPWLMAQRQSSAYAYCLPKVPRTLSVGWSNYYGRPLGPATQSDF